MTGDLSHQQVHRNRDAVPLYALMLGGLSIPLVLLLLTSRQWDVISGTILLMTAMLRYLLPVSATVLPDGRVRYVWPLRRVTVGPENLVTARVLPNTISQEPMLALRVRNGARFAGFSSRWTEGPRLAAALACVVAEASGVPASDRQASATLLDTAARRHS
jgi:hypothetical protein